MRAHLSAPTLLQTDAGQEDLLLPRDSFLSAVPFRATGLVTRGAHARSWEFDLSRPPAFKTHARDPRPLGYWRSLVARGQGNQPNSMRPPRWGRRRPPPRSPGRPRGALFSAQRSAPRPESAPAPLARCGVSVSPAGFSPLRWSGK